VIQLRLTGCVVLALAAGCTSSATQPVDVAATSAPSPSVGPEKQNVRVTRDGHRGPRACHPRNVGRVVVDFFAALNRGNAGGAANHFTDDLGWYSATEGNPEGGRRHFVAYDAAELRTYLNQRVAEHERLYLLSIDVDYEPARNIGHVAFSGYRTADDLTDFSPRVGGKGGIDCATGRIAVWSLAQHARPVPGNLCPGRPDRPTVAIACARRRAASA
jgi:hypothetical protein